MSSPKIELFPISRELEPSEWESDAERVNWIMFLMGFFVGCASTIALILIR